MLVGRNIAIMKRFLVLLVLLYFSCTHTVAVLVEKDGIWYAPKTDIPYSGKWTWWYDNGQKWSEGTFKDGKEDGLVAELYRNGQKNREGTYKDGKWISKCWDEDGNEMDCPPAEEVE